MKNKGTIITIAVLLVIVMVESVLLITGTFTKIPKNANGEDIAVSLNDGTNYTVNKTGGSKEVKLTVSQIPAHQHPHTHKHTHDRGDMDITGSFPIDDIKLDKNQP